MVHARIAVVFVVMLSFHQRLLAQDTGPAPPTTPTSPLGISDITKHFLQEEGQLWTSPLRVQQKDLKWLLPIGGGTAALFFVDRRISDEAREATSLQRPSQIISQAGNVPPAVVPLGLWALGKASHNERMSQAGIVGVDTFLHSALIVQALKTATNRERPSKLNGDGGFWDGGKSFPSGHAMTTWALAAAMADQYPDKRWVSITGYGVASAVSLARVGGLNHYPSDVLVGASLGWMVGHYVSRHHKHEN